MYNKLAGMTGTAETEATEFQKIYKLKVQVIPTNKPIKRADKEDVIYKTENIKYKYIAQAIKELHKKKQPVLVGTVSIEKSERLSELLLKENIPHNVLNAKYHEKEAEIVAQAGRLGAITIATNMAGRGTDIVLGGNPEALAGGKGKEENLENYKKRLKKFEDICSKEKEQVIQAGGLFIIGTERHEARRIDNQLRGRSGRQGDPGASKFYLSLEDDLMRVFGGERMQKLMGALRMDEEAPITDRLLSRAIANAQRKVEGHNFEIRKHILEYDDVMNQQRMSVYALRNSIMEGKNLERQFLDRMTDVVSEVLNRTVSEDVKKEDWNIKQLVLALKHGFDVDLNLPPLESLEFETVNKEVEEKLKLRFEEKKEELQEHFNPLIQFLLLQTLDARWREHLENVDHLREGINLRAFAQKDPLVEYKKESFHLFESLNLLVATEVVEKFFKIKLSGDPSLKQEKQSYREEKEELKSFETQRSQGDRKLNRKQRRLQKSGSFKSNKIKI